MSVIHNSYSCYRSNKSEAYRRSAKMDGQMQVEQWRETNSTAREHEQLLIELVGVVYSLYRMFRYFIHKPISLVPACKEHNTSIYNIHGYKDMWVQAAGLSSVLMQALTGECKWNHILYAINGWYMNPKLNEDEALLFSMRWAEKEWIPISSLQIQRVLISKGSQNYDIINKDLIPNHWSLCD